MKLYHYVHCPFCVRVRLALGWLNIAYESVVLPYNDETTPLELTGVKMLPIMEIQGLHQNESLEIIKALDAKNTLKLELLEESHQLKELEEWLTKLGAPIHNLCMPYWVWTPEFDADSRLYFVDKKSKKRGPFEELMLNQQKDLSELNQHLLELEKLITPFYGQQKSITIFDIMLAAHLWGMTIHPEFQFSSTLWDYLMRVKSLCEFDYHRDFKQKKYFT